MNKKLIAFFSILSLSLSLSQAPANAVAKAGAKCAKAGITEVVKDKSYTCVKTGKKLVWNKGVKGVKVAPISLTRREKAFSEVKRVYDLSSSYQPTVEYIFASDAPQNFAEVIKEVIPISARFWSSEFKPTTEFPIILGSPASVEWVNDELKRYGLVLPRHARESITNQGENAGKGDVEKSSRGAVTYYEIGKEKDRSIKAGNEINQRGFVAHEYVHAVAISIIGHRQKGIPGWSVEGSAQYYGIAIAALMAEQPNATMNRISTEQLSFLPRQEGKLIPHSLNKDDLYKTVITMEQGGPTCWEPKYLCYTAGFLFTEVLVADHGHDKFVDWWKLSRKKNWEVAFEEVYGIQIDKWYEEVAIPYVIQESKDAIPTVAAPKSASTFTQHPTRPPRPFIDPSLN